MFFFYLGIFLQGNTSDLKPLLLSINHTALLSISLLAHTIYGSRCTRGDQKVRGKVLLHRIAFIDCNENS